jgi:hypothetical protein
MASVVLNREADDEVQVAVDLAWFAKQTGALPQAGGILDQDIYYLRLLRAGLQAFEEQERQESKKNGPKNVTGRR